MVEYILFAGGPDDDAMIGVAKTYVKETGFTAADVRIVRREGQVLVILRDCIGWLELGFNGSKRD